MSVIMFDMMFMARQKPGFGHAERSPKAYIAENRGLLIFLDLLSDPKYWIYLLMSTHL